MHTKTMLLAQNESAKDAGEKKHSASKLFARNVLLLIKYSRRNVGEFESYIGVSRGYFSRLANGHGSISCDKALMIAGLLNEPIAELLTKDYVDIFAEEERNMEIMELSIRLQALKGGST